MYTGSKDGSLHGDKHKAVLSLRTVLRLLNVYVETNKEIYDKIRFCYSSTPREIFIEDMM